MVKLSKNTWRQPLQAPASLLRTVLSNSPPFPRSSSTVALALLCSGDLEREPVRERFAASSITAPRNSMPDSNQLSSHTTDCIDPTSNLGMHGGSPSPISSPTSSGFQNIRLRVDVASVCPVSPDSVEAEIHSELDRGESDESVNIGWEENGCDSPQVNSKEESCTSGRQRLHRHRVEVAGNVSIPDTWGREQLLQDWVSFGRVEDALRPPGLMSARNALINDSQSRVQSSTTPSGVSKLLNVSIDVEVS